MRKAGFLGVLFLAVAVAGSVHAGPAACPGLEARLAALDHADRRQWESEGLAADPYAIERERSAVLRELAANGCGGQAARRNKRPNGPLAGLFGNKRPFRNGPFRNGPFREGGLFGGGDGLFGQGAYGNDFSYGTYRTLCVRTCDGYYFPISFSARGGELQRDQNACRALCPGKEVALYVQRNGEDGGPMFSLAGQPYTALPTAFRYRSEYNRECACGPVDAATAAAFQAFSMPPPAMTELLLPSPTGAIVQPLVPSPPSRVAADDPETLLNRAGRMAPKPVTREPLAEATYRQGPDGRVVRLVGPEASYLSE